MSLRKSIFFILSVFILRTGPVAALEGIPIDVSVDPKFSHFKSLLEYPPILARAIQNVGQSIFPSGYMVLSGPHTLGWRARRGARFKSATIQFKEMRQNTYLYDVHLEWGPFANVVDLQVHVDTALIQKGKARIQLFFPGAGIYGRLLKPIIEKKIRAYYKDLMDRGVLKYLDGVSRYKSIDFPPIATKIFTDALNDFNFKGIHQPQDSQFEIHRIFLITSLCLWFGVGPLVIFTLYLWKRLQLALAKPASNMELNPSRAPA